MDGRNTALGVRLRHARERSALSLSRVKERTGVGESSLSDFENGKREPSLSQLTALARCYRRPIAFFLSDEPVPTDTVLWRSRPEANAEEIEAEFLQLCTQYHNLEIWCGSKATVELPLAYGTPRPLGFGDAEELAKDIRRKLTLGDRPGQTLLRELEERCGVKVFHLPFEPTGTAACALSEAFGAGILLNANNRSWRRNFDLAHELYHLLTWHIMRPASGSGVQCSTDEERLANTFAANLLMPMDAIRSAVNERLVERRLSMEAVFDIARQFDVSVESLLWRLHWIYRRKEDEPKTKKDIEAARAKARLLEEREQERVPTRPARFRALAVTALSRGEVSIGRFAEYMGISRREAMRYVEQEPPADEEIELASA